MARNFLNKCYPTVVAAQTANGTSTVTSSIVDTAGYKGVVFFTALSTANATNTIKVQQNTANQTTGMSDLAGTSVTSGASDEHLIVEVHQPQERYVQVVVSRGASTSVGEIWAVLYDGTTSPSAISLSGTRIAEMHVQPAEGTA